MHFKHHFFFWNVENARVRTPPPKMWNFPIFFFWRVPLLNKLNRLDVEIRPSLMKIMENVIMYFNSYLHYSSLTIILVVDVKVCLLLVIENICPCPHPVQALDNVSMSLTSVHHHHMSASASVNIIVPNVNECLPCLVQIIKNVSMSQCSLVMASSSWLLWLVPHPNHSKILQITFYLLNV